MFNKIVLINLIVLIISFTLAASHKLYYIREDEYLDFFKASEKCKALGLNLVSIKSREEMEYLKEYIKKEYGRVYPYWLGAYRKNGQFEWTATGENITQFFWHTGEPNDKSGAENCIHTWQDDFDWNDNDCERELPYICDLEI